MTERQVKLFRNGRNQVVRIPREFELPGRAAVMRKEGERLIIEPAAPRALLALARQLGRSRRGRALPRNRQHPECLCVSGSSTAVSFFLPARVAA